MTSDQRSDWVNSFSYSIKKLFSIDKGGQNFCLIRWLYFILPDKERLLHIIRSVGKPK